MGMDAGIRAEIRTTAKTPGKLKISVKGTRAMLAVVPTDLPFTATVLIDVPVAMTGQCATKAFTGPAPAPTCRFNKRGTAVRCK